MVNYYWSKYNNVQEHSYSVGSWAQPSASTVDIGQLFYPDYYFQADGTPIGSGSPIALKNGVSPPSGYYYISLGTLYKVESSGHRDEWTYWFVNMRKANITKTTIDKMGSLIQSGIIASENAYVNNKKNYDGYWYVRGSVVNTAPTTPTILNVVGTLEVGKTLTINVGGSSDAENTVQYALEVSRNNGAFSVLSTNTTTSRSYAIPSGTTSLQFRVRAYDGALYSGYKTGSVLSVNTVPTISISSPGDAITYYENDILGIAGSVTDVNAGNVVSVKYSIDGGAPQAITAIVSNGSASSFAKNLTYKNGALYDGATAITGQLAEGSQHTLKMWAEDDKGGKSPEITRTFYVVPNRAASLTLDAFITRTGLINTDVVNVSGAVADLDNGNVIVKYKIGNGAFVQVYNGQASSTPTPFNFNILLADLADGANQITIQAVDAYNAITQQVLSLTKTANEQPLLSAVTYYEITPPNGATDGLQLYVERELGDLVVSADVFMGASGETEVFVPMTLASTANLTNGNVEDTFSYQHSTDATKVVIRINMSRASAATNKAIKKISGVLT